MKADTPIQINSVRLKNRITFAPTVKFDYTDDSGLATEKHVRHYRLRAKGGCGLICVEATAVVPGGRFWKNHMGLWNDEQRDSHRPIVDACKSEGAAVIVQLNHTGYASNPQCGQPIGPSAVRRSGFQGEYTTVEMTKDEIHQMQDAFISAARRAKEAGYDGIQLHGCHGYLINQFISPLANFREDEYGGTVENRARFAGEIIAGIRKVCGKDFLISVRTSGYEGSVEDAVGIAEAYIQAGCDYLQVSNGIAGLETLAPYPDEKIDAVRSLGVRFHEHFKGRVPISCVGGINTPELARYLIEKELADTVDVARAILADPEFANAVIFDRPYRRCCGCKACQYGPFTDHRCPAGSE